MKKSFWIRIHLYCGLFTSFYLLAFGVSSIVLNHKLNVDNDKVATTWTTYVSFDPNSSDLDIALQIRDSLNLMGWVPPWEIKRDSLSLDFKVTHLGKTINFQLNPETGLLHAKERPKGFLAVMHGLHFFNGNVPNAPSLLRTWALYQWLTLFVLLISLFIGVWIWIRYSHKTWELYVFGGIFLISVLLMTQL